MVLIGLVKVYFFGEIKVIKLIRQFYLFYSFMLYILWTFSWGI